MRVDTVQATSACQFQKPIGVVATNEHAAAEMEQSKTRNHRARHKTRASLLSDKGLDAANHNPRFRRREKNVLDIPSYRTGDSAHNWSMSPLGILRQQPVDTESFTLKCERGRSRVAVTYVRIFL